MIASAVCVYQVETSEGRKDYVSILPPERLSSRGLPPEAIVGVLSRPLDEGDVITPENFARNRIFVEFLHAAIARRGPLLPGLVAEAKRQGDGSVVVIDGRTRTPAGAVPPEDIIGAFAVKDGQVVPNSYLANPRHRIVSTDGFFRLPAELHAALLEELANLP